MSVRSRRVTRRPHVTRVLSPLITAVFVLLVARPAAAHIGIGPTNGFTAGLLHPLGGLDHLLAMLGVGLLAARGGGRILWQVPVTFLAFLVIGAALAFAGVPVPGVETGIALSLLVFAAALLLPDGVLPPAALALTATFGLFHGHAHGSEMPADVFGLAYGGGFVAASAGLHLAGMTLSRLPGRAFEPFLRTACALAMTTTGVLALAG